MIGKQRSDLILLVGIPLIAVLISGTILLNYTGDVGNQFATLVVGGVSAFATAALAIATYTTVLQNRRTVEELQKDREKPLAEDKLRQLIVPLISKLERKIDTIERGNATWVHISNTLREPVGSVPTGHLLTDEIGDTVIQEMQKNNPELLEEIKDHDELSDEVDDAVEQVIEDVEHEVSELAEEQDFENDDGENIDANHLARYVLGGFESRDPPRNHENLWSSHEEELTGLKDSEIEETLQKLEERYLACCRSLNSELVDYKVELQQRYGISEKDISELDSNNLF